MKIFSHSEWTNERAEKERRKLMFTMSENREKHVVISERQFIVVVDDVVNIEFIYE